MGQSFFQGTQKAFEIVEQRMQMMDHQIVSLTKVLKEIIGKELLRGQALHKVLMDKGLFNDADLKTALETIIAEAQADLKNEAEKVAQEKADKVEMLVPEGYKPKVQE